MNLWIGEGYNIYDYTDRRKERSKDFQSYLNPEYIYFLGP